MTARLHREDVEVLAAQEVQAHRVQHMHTDVLAAQEVQAHRVQHMHVDVLRENILTQPQRVQRMHIDVLRPVEYIVVATNPEIPIMRLSQNGFWFPIQSASQG